MAQFRISTNIKRDANAELDYIVTKNANEVYERIIHGFGKGQKSFTIIGSYGTGKSTFLWAFENHLKGNLKFNNPVNGEFKGRNKFVFKHIVGETTSLRKQFCKEVLDKEVDDFATNKEIISLLDQYVKGLKKTTLVLMFDEFGKHLEYIAKYQPEEMYFIQELAEYCNGPESSVLLLTTLHQNFSVYAKGLTKEEKNEWDKVNGRLIDVNFDEPVEQLLFFAANRLENIAVPKKLNSSFQKAIVTIQDSGLLGKKRILNKNDFEKLYPLDPLAADILVKSLQRYGQNERSLFTFLESKELDSIKEESRFFTVPECFDYLLNNLSTEIEDGEKNPFKPQWKSTLLALDKAEHLFEKDYTEVSKIIKLISLVNIFSSAAGVLDEDIIDSYANNILEINNGKEIINSLVKNRIIKFSNHRSKFNFIEGTDLDLELELLKSAQSIDRKIDLVARLEAYFDFGIIPAKKVQYEFGTPRFFEFRFLNSVDDPKEPEGAVDGYINLVFTKKRIETKLKDLANQGSPCQIYVLFKEVDQVEETIFEIDKLIDVQKRFSDDKVALRIINEELSFRRSQLRSFVEGSMFSEEAKVTWIWNKTLNEYKKFPRKITSISRLNRLLSEAASFTYNKAPVYRNEMVNKEVLSSPILTARKALIRQIISHSGEAELGFDKKKFPPQKTIFLSLLDNTKIYVEKDGAFIFQAPPEDSSFKPLWDESERVLAESKDGKSPVSNFYEALYKAPFKLKKGFLDYWIPIFLIIKQEDYSLYHENGEYIPHLTDDVMDLIYKHPTKYLVKALSAEGVKSEYLSQYKELVGYNESSIKGLETSYITIYSNFLRFYRGLEEYTKKTKSISKAARDVRDAIEKAKDPESALFDKIPEALGYIGDLKEKKGSQSFVRDLQEAIKTLRSTYSSLVDSIQDDIQQYLAFNADSFDVFKEQVSKRFKSVNPNLIQDHKLKLFLQRVTSPLDVKTAYWESLCDATLGKKLNKIKDEEVPVLVDRMKDSLQTLLDLGKIHQRSDETGQDVKQITILGKSAKQRVKTFIKKDHDRTEIKELREKLAKVLGDANDEVSKIALLELLEERF